MKYKYLINFDDEASCIASEYHDLPTGERVEDVRIFIRPDPGEHRLFTMTSNVWHPVDFLTPYHVHEKGYETFFLKSGSLQLFVHGKQCRVESGSIIHYQPHQSHGLRFLELCEARGFFNDFAVIDNAGEMGILESYDQESYKKLKETRMLTGEGRDGYECEQVEYDLFPAEEVPNVRMPDRPMAEFKLDGITMKMMIARWELGGLREIWRLEMKEGFRAESVEFPRLRELYYMTEGEVEFKIYDDTFTAKGDCMIDIPKFLKHSITVKADAVMYDVGGLSNWYYYLHDYTAVKKSSPEKYNDSGYMEELKKKYNVQIKSIGYK